MPTSRELVEELASDDGSISPDMPLLQALTAKQTREVRSSLLEFITEQIPNPPRFTLPAHRQIANLPLWAVIRTNWYRCLETALDKERLQFDVVASDTDIPRLRPSHIPIVKFHGTIDDVNTIVATLDDVLRVRRRNPLISSLLQILVAQGTVLFLGYALDDADFLILFEELKSAIGEFRRRSYAVHRHPTPNTEDYWRRHDIHIIDADATEFLQLLSRSVYIESKRLEVKHLKKLLPRGGSRAITDLFKWIKDLEAWNHDPVLRHVIRAEALPTESSVIEGLARATKELVNTGSPLGQVEAKLTAAIEKVRQHRPNYQVLNGFQKELQRWFRGTRIGEVVK